MKGAAIATGCPNCGRASAAGDRFCGGCGAALPRTCAHCGRQLTPDAAFCTGCGNPTGGNPTGGNTKPDSAEDRRRDETEDSFNALWAMGGRE